MVGRESAGFVAGDRSHGLRAIEPDEFVELVRQARVKIMAGQFGLRTIDDADRAFESLGHQFFAHGVATRVS